MALSYKPTPPSAELPISFYEAIGRTSQVLPSNPIVKGLTRGPSDYEQSVNAIPSEIKQLNVARGLIHANLFSRANGIVDNLVKSSVGLSNKVTYLHGKKILSEKDNTNPILGETAKPSNLREMSLRKD